MSPDPVSNAIIEVKSVSKSFRQYRRFSGFTGAVRSLFTRQFTEVAAVTDISFSVGAGEAVGYLGPNGAGKSTMIKMMTGILVPGSGELNVLGRTPHANRMINAREIGVVFGQRSQLWWDLPVRDSFELHRHIYAIGNARFNANLNHYVGLLDLKALLDRPVRQLSLGQRMRAEIVMALLHDPKILFLDEPTIGLDVVAKDAVRQSLAEVNRERGVTIVLTTHDLQDIEQICPRLIMVDRSCLIFDGPLKRLRSSLGSHRRVAVEFAIDPGPLQLGTVRTIADNGIRKTFVIENDSVSLADVLNELGRERILKDIALEEPTIEEVIRDFYRARDRERLAV